MNNGNPDVSTADSIFKRKLSILENPAAGA